MALTKAKIMRARRKALKDAGLEKVEIYMDKDDKPLIEHIKSFDKRYEIKKK